MLTTKATPQAISELYSQRLQQLNDLHGLMESLKTAFPQTPTFNVLSIGCGDEPLELPALETFFQGQNQTFHYVGVDIEKGDIEVCKKTHVGKAYQFHAVNGKDYRKIKDLFAGQPIHLIILRHPILYLNNPITQEFKIILTTTVPYLLSPGGAVLSSLHYGIERDCYLEVMRSVTSSALIELPACDKHYIRTEQTSAFFKSTEHIYSDQYFVAITQFQPTPLIQAEVANDYQPLTYSYTSVVDEFISQLNKDLNSDGIKRLFCEALQKLTTDGENLMGDSCFNQVVWALEKQVRYKTRESLANFVNLIFAVMTLPDTDNTQQKMQDCLVVLQRGLPADPANKEKLSGDHCVMSSSLGL